jgi:hypothetical protein
MTMTAPDRTAAPELVHPSLGHAGEASLSPITPFVYQATHGDRVVGFLESAGPVWVALVGGRYDQAVEVGQHATLAAALRQITNVD